MPDNIYLSLTRQFNAGRVRAVVCSGQAAVLHRVAIMSKDGDWILREDEEALSHVLGVLTKHGARYRFGAPLDRRWLAGGWSAHFEFHAGPLRVRTDFFTRPPRLTPADLERLWAGAEQADIPVVGLVELAEQKKTNREKDYAVIGELSRRMTDPRDQLRYSRSARDLIELSRRYPDLVQALLPARPLLGLMGAGIEPLEVALDAERRQAMHRNEDRLAVFTRAASAWASAWPTVERQIGGQSLRDAHVTVIRHAEQLLPFAP
ncbi:MAG: hypothetical protein A3K19_13090 [Lentisphaerae bacterium RIFOXYB12_FULL_65_16]|nr:MAG: hypothetical protein A3K18_04615 [Lentisphaerae bacterium RIFOXYA12_64_32]OGV87245.1 MAG: hypothetical protein A3K19_13090 [Lentisphaerae bacterium RIFOXYB12_FULL_65_16]